MSSLWVIVLVLVLGAGLLLVRAVRHSYDEVTPTVEAFARFRRAIAPAVASLRAETVEARRRIDRGATEIGDAQG